MNSTELDSDMPRLECVPFFRDVWDVITAFKSDEETAQFIRGFIYHVRDDMPLDKCTGTPMQFGWYSASAAIANAKRRMEMSAARAAAGRAGKGTKRNTGNRHALKDKSGSVVPSRGNQNKSKQISTYTRYKNQETSKSSPVKGDEKGNIGDDCTLDDIKSVSDDLSWRDLCPGFSPEEFDSALSAVLMNLKARGWCDGNGRAVENRYAYFACALSEYARRKSQNVENSQCQYDTVPVFKFNPDAM